LETRTVNQADYHFVKCSGKAVCSGQGATGGSVPSMAGDQVMARVAQR